MERPADAEDNKLIADYFDYGDCAEEALVVTVRKLKGKRKEFLFVLFVGKDLPQKRAKKNADRTIRVFHFRYSRCQNLIPTEK